MLPKLVEKYPEKPWSYYLLSSNPNITLTDVRNHPEIPWSYEYLSQNPNITLKDILNHPEIPWSYDYLSINPNITLEFIEKNIDQIDFNILSQNTFFNQNLKDLLIKIGIINDMTLIINKTI